MPLVLDRRGADPGAEAVAETALQLRHIAAVVGESQDSAAGESSEALLVPFAVADFEIDRAVCSEWLAEPRPWPVLVAADTELVTELLAEVVEESLFEASSLSDSCSDQGSLEVK